MANLFLSTPPSMANPPSPLPNHISHPPGPLQPPHQRVSKGTATKAPSSSGPQKKPTRCSNRLKQKEGKDCSQTLHAQINPKEDGLSSGKVSSEASAYGDLPHTPQHNSGKSCCNSFPCCSPYPLSTVSLGERVDESEGKLGLACKANGAGPSADEQGGTKCLKQKTRDSPASVKGNTSEMKTAEPKENPTKKKTAEPKENPQKPEIQPSNEEDQLKRKEEIPAPAIDKGSLGQMVEGREHAGAVGNSSDQLTSAGHGGIHKNQGSSCQAAAEIFQQRETQQMTTEVEKTQLGTEKPNSETCMEMEFPPCSGKRKTAMLAKGG